MSNKLNRYKEGDSLIINVPLNKINFIKIGAHIIKTDFMKNRPYKVVFSIPLLLKDCKNPLQKAWVNIKWTGKMQIDKSDLEF